MAEPTSYASKSELGPNRTLLTSGRNWELSAGVRADDVSPDLIGDLTRILTSTLLDQAFKRMVALDWTTATVKMHPRGKRDVKFIVSVDVL